MNSPLDRQHGFSMIEVLIAVLILSFGISSIGMMMLTTLQNTRGAALRGKAVALAQDMAERIRANYAGREFYDTSVTTGANKTCFETGATAASDCSPHELAQHDIFQWRQMLADTVAGLPDANASVTRDTSTTPPEYDIRISWTDGTNADGLVTQTFTLSTRP